MNNRNEKWFWLLDPKGNFSVRSSYRKLLGKDPKPYARFWMKIWSTATWKSNILTLESWSCLPPNNSGISKEKGPNSKKKSVVFAGKGDRYTCVISMWFCWICMVGIWTAKQHHIWPKRWGVRCDTQGIHISVKRKMCVVRIGVLEYME